MTNETQFWLIAGPNGAGKSTLAQSAVFNSLPIPRTLNPHEVTRALLIHQGYQGFTDAPPEIYRDCSIGAANWMYGEVERHIRAGLPVSVETVLSTDKYLALFKEVFESGGETHLIYVGNHSPEISIERVAARVQRDGHGIPDDKIRVRWHRSLGFLTEFWPYATQRLVFDNSNSSFPGPTLLYHSYREN